MDKNEFGIVRTLIRAVWKGVLDNDEQMEAWFESLKKYSLMQVESAARAYIETSRFEPKPADIIGFIPKGQNKSDFDPTPRFETINGKTHRVYICPRCQDSGMLTWEDENQCIVGVPCDCPAGHYYYRWGWLTKEQQEAWCNDPKNGHHGEWIGENWYDMQPEARRRAYK